MSRIYIINMDQNLNETIKQVYYNQSGFKSVRNTYLDVKQVIPDVKLKQVKDWFNKAIEKKSKEIRGYNSYVAPRAYHEYQIDLFFVTKNQMKNQEYPMGLMMIDVFTKFAAVVPLESNKPVPFLNAILEGFGQMGRYPEILYSDQEGSLFNKNVRNTFEDASVQLITTTTHAPVVERMNRTFKNALFKRVEHRRTQDADANIQWTDFVEPIMKQYNNTVHSSTGKTPIEARKSSNEMDVKIALEMKAKRGRKYPELQVGDTVRILRNKKLGEKENVAPFRNGRFNIEAITENFGQKFYLIKGVQYVRSDLVKVTN